MMLSNFCRKLLLPLFLCGIVLMPGCDVDALLGDDLAMAKKAGMDRDWPLAERLLERCLRKEQNPERRWEAWNLLLNALNAINQENMASLECLDAMLAEYSEDEEKLALILPQIAKNNEALRRYGRAEDAWSAYIDLGAISNEQRMEGYRNLAASQFSQRHFEAGEDSLEQCLALPVPDHDKIFCMLDLADENMARERWQEVNDLCQQIMDSEPDAAVLGIAGYLRGDALEQMGKKEEALAQFEAARDAYPNPAVMDNRIAHLRKILGKKNK